MENLPLPELLDLEGLGGPIGYTIFAGENLFLIDFHQQMQIIFRASS
jgi:hypothetical protein